MFKHFVTLLIGSTMAAQAMAQLVDWLVAQPVDYTLNSAFAGHHLARSQNGQLFSARATTNNVHLTGSLAGDIAVERLDPATGGVIAACAISGPMVVDRMITGPDGRSFVGGRIQQTITFCDGTQLQHSGSSTNTFLVAFDEDLEILWARNLLEEHPWAWSMKGLSVDPSGTLWYAVGDFQNTIVCSTNASGMPVDQWYIGGARVVGSIDHDPWGALYVAGGAGSGIDMDFGGIIEPVPYFYARFVLRIDANGNGSWVRFAQDGTFEETRVVCDNNGSAYVSGSLSADTQFGDIPLYDPPWGGSVYLLKVDSSGTFLWGRQALPPEGQAGQAGKAKHMSLTVDGADNVYLTATVRGIVDWGNGMLSTAGEPAQASQTIAGFQPDGGPLWTLTSTPLHLSTHPQTLTTDAAGEIHFAAHVNGAYGFGEHEISAQGQQWVLGRIPAQINTAMAGHHAPAPAIRLWPNPAREQLNISYHADAPATARMHDALGRTVQEFRLVPGHNILELRGLPSGPYYVRTNAGAATVVVD
jgi:hypothetical protein